MRTKKHTKLICFTVYMAWAHSHTHTHVNGLLRSHEITAPFQSRQWSSLNYREGTTSVARHFQMSPNALLHRRLSSRNKPWRRESPAGTIRGRFKRSRWLRCSPSTRFVPSPTAQSEAARSVLGGTKMATQLLE